MSLEIERKYLDVDFAELRSRLRSLGAEYGGRHFERNLVFDTHDAHLLESGKLLRLRLQQWIGTEKSLLTLKLPVGGFSGYKARKETEVAVGSFGDMTSIINGLGFMIASEYEKVRESWKYGSVRVELDVLPFASVVELEGDPCEIDRAARTLGLDKHETSTKSYHELYAAWREKQGLGRESSFVFPPDRKKALLS